MANKIYTIDLVYTATKQITLGADSDKAAMEKAVLAANKYGFKTIKLESWKNAKSDE